MIPEVCACGHGWLYHHKYEEFCGKFIEVACDGGCGCICQEWRPSVAETVKALGYSPRSAEKKRQSMDRETII